MAEVLNGKRGGNEAHPRLYLSVSREKAVMLVRPFAANSTVSAAIIRVVETVLFAAKSRDAREAFRCEQHGFYYTNDGRCVQPILRGKQSP